MDEDKKVFNETNIPEDAEVYSTPPKVYEPIDPSEMYTVEVLKAELKENIFYKPDEKDVSKRGNKYAFNLEFAILDDGKYYGRRLWDSASPSFKPAGKKGASKLHKIVTNAMKVDFGWDECASFAPDMKTFFVNLQKEVVGKQLRVSTELVKNEKTGKVSSKITTYNRTKADLPAFDADKAKAMGELARSKGGGERVDPKDIPF